MASVIRGLDGCPMRRGPGDRLTVGYAHGRAADGPEDRLLAARSLLQVAMTVKEEMAPTAAVPYPHIRDEFETIELVNRLEYDECRALYPRVRSMPPVRARAVIETALV